MAPCFYFWLLSGLTVLGRHLSGTIFLLLCVLLSWQCVPSADLLVRFGVIWGHRSRGKDRVLLEKDIQMQRGCSSREGCVAPPQTCPSTVHLSACSSSWWSECWALIPILKAGKLRHRGVKVTQECKFKFRFPSVR